jgi:ribosomal RNA assembly protein
MRFVRIPLDRIAVLVGHQGEVKNKIESTSNIPIVINSENGEVTIQDENIEDPLMVFKVENIVKAIGRGFSPEHAMALFDDSMDFYLFDIHDYVGKRRSHVQRVKARVIGRNGKTKRVLEELTESYISIYGHTIGVIGSVLDIDITKKAIDKLLTGSKHATVYRFIEKNMKQLRLQQGF